MFSMYIHFDPDIPLFGIYLLFIVHRDKDSHFRLLCNSEI